MLSKKEANGIVSTPNVAKMAMKTDVWIGLERVFTPDGDGRLHPSCPTPWIKTGSGSGVTFLLKNESDEDDEDDEKVFFGELGRIGDGVVCT